MCPAYFRSWTEARGYRVLWQFLSWRKKRRNWGELTTYCVPSILHQSLHSVLRTASAGRFGKVKQMSQGLHLIQVSGRVGFEPKPRWLKAKIFSLYHAASVFKSNWGHKTSTICSLLILIGACAPGPLDRSIKILPLSALAENSVDGAQICATVPGPKVTVWTSYPSASRHRLHQSLHGSVSQLGHS